MNVSLPNTLSELTNERIKKLNKFIGYLNNQIDKQAFREVVQFRVHCGTW